MNGQIELSSYDLIVINNSGGKDSLCSIFEICRLAKDQNFPLSQIHLSHQILDGVEWEGVLEVVQEQATYFGLECHFSQRRKRNGDPEKFLEYVERRKKWPSNKQRWCTSDFKRGPGARVVTKLTSGMKNCKILYVFGFRAQESPARSKKEALVINKMLTTQSRLVHDFLPIHSWDLKQVWETI